VQRLTSEIDEVPMPCYALRSYNDINWVMLQFNMVISQYHLWVHIAF
jgi:hypothetical protein